MLMVEAGYAYSPDLAEELYFRIKELEASIARREVTSQEEYMKGREKGLQQAAELCDTTKYYDFREKGAVASLRNEILSLLEDS